MSVMLGEATDRPTADASSAPEGHAGQPRAAHRSSRPSDGGCRNARTMCSQPSLLNSGNRASWRSTWFSTAGCLVPPGADADVQSTDADVVDGHCHFRQDRRMAIDHTGYQRVDPRPLGNSCHGGQRRPALERRLGEFRRPQKWSQSQIPSKPGRSAACRNCCSAEYSKLRWNSTDIRMRRYLGRCGVCAARSLSIKVQCGAWRGGQFFKACQQVPKWLTSSCARFVCP